MIPENPGDPSSPPAARAAGSRAHALRAARPPALAIKKKSPAEDPEASLSQVIDTIEAIIIALIVALTFRAFVVEAFVIPTGSMAPTLLGAHFDVTCPRCGFSFSRDADLRFQGAHLSKGLVAIEDRGTTAELGANNLVPADDYFTGSDEVTCPNCRLQFNSTQFPQFLGKLYVEDYRRGSPDSYVHGKPREAVPFVWANNGDRILVLKYLYSLMEPSRWDVIVFKEPQRAKTNYIKRLVGLPGETIEIINGDIYVLPPQSPANDPSLFQIARKPDYIQNSLWQLVYNNDFFPGSYAPPDAMGPMVVPFSNPWESADPWTQAKSPIMSYDGAKPSQLHFNITAPQAADSPYTLNILGYNNDAKARWIEGSERMPRAYVGDLRLETLWTPATADAAKVKMTLGRTNNCYQVSWESGHVILSHYDPVAKTFTQVSAYPVADPEAGRSYSLAMNNVDHSTQFYIDGTKIFSYDQPWSAAQALEDEQKYPSMFEPDQLTNDTHFPVPTDPARRQVMISIDVGGKCTLAHLKLSRDLYYTQAARQGGEIDNPPTGTVDHAITLHPDEFFALGDNSRKSYDGRLWNSAYDAAGDLALRNGIVPRRYLLGKAFFVYWPAGYRASTTIPMLDQWPLVPNVGKMRIIR